MSWDALHPVLHLILRTILLPLLAVAVRAYSVLPAAVCTAGSRSYRCGSWRVWHALLLHTRPVVAPRRLDPTCYAVACWLRAGSFPMLPSGGEALLVRGHCLGVPLLFRRRRHERVVSGAVHRYHDEGSPDPCS